ncbi:type II toxin-antitoxin system prevent-host-death family antitoxin [Tessaracoccus caeni]|uniref:type II toxin-antitoxin system prevent-host-death family antitoxin n=1 Tax=Tessaracoccus caeni TaxID=3031239 RepID=UPI0023DB756F|nr:type II toxin-antitoxin system prevent-host-death family antitoxin [Tessaracoccus caeni]MDF1489112.1 type II toxin-antitoxin system prevent-host-death family antitoxin [Tessaracoccus caeni]
MTSMMTSRDLNRDVSAAKRAANDGPVIITDRGEPAYVLLAIDDYRRLKDHRTIVDVLRMDEPDIVFEPVVLRDLPRAAEL